MAGDVINLTPRHSPLIRRPSVDDLPDRALRTRLGWIDDMALLARLRIADGAAPAAVLPRLLTQLEACLAPDLPDDDEA